MNQNEREQIYLKAIKQYGRVAQALVAVEELAELQKELLKNINRNKWNREQIIDEIADVRIMLEQLNFIYGIENDELEERVKEKVERLRQKIYKLD